MNENNRNLQNGPGTEYNGQVYGAGGVTTETAPNGPIWYPIGVPAEAATVPEKEKTVFSASDSVFAWLSFIAGYALCRTVPVTQNPLGAFIFILALFAVTIGFLAAKGARLTPAPVLAAAAAVAVSTSLILSGDDTLTSWAFIFSLVFYVYFVYSATGNSLIRGFSNLVAGDFLRALFVLPFCSLGDIYRAAFSGRSNGGVRVFGKIMLGLALAIIPTTIVILLLSYDSDFSRLIRDIIEFDIGDIFSHIGSIMFGIPIGMYIFGLYSSAVNKKCENRMTAESFSNTGKACRFVPAVTVGAAVLPLLFVYGVFFVSQWKYYVSGFTGVLPEEFSYAEYAREGFFQLCAVSVINLIVIIAAALFMKRKTEKPPIILKVVSVLYALSTLVLISTAMAKMVMYIDSYGLTRKRVFSSVFMIALAVVFIMITVKQFASKFKVVPLSAAVCVLLFAALALSDANSIIMKYNVDRYLDGSLKTVDINATYDLGHSAVPELVELAEILDERHGGSITSGKGIKADDETEEMYKRLGARLREAAAELRYEDDGIFSFNASKVRAKAALEEAGFRV